MHWKYCFPHEWNLSREVWEDVYLRPAEPAGAPGIHLTIDALGDTADPSHGSDRAAFQTEAIQKLGDSDYWTSGGDMIVRCRDFSRDELLEWVRVCLRHHGFEVTDLIEASASEFEDTIEHAALVAGLKTQGEATLS